MAVPSGNLAPRFHATGIEAYVMTYDKQQTASSTVQEDLPQSPVPTSGTLDPSLVASDQQRKQEIQDSAMLRTPDRPTFTALIRDTVSGPGHKTVENFLVGMFRPTPDRQKYAQYLCNLQHDIGIVEALLRKENLPMKTLTRLYFAQKIAQDLSQLQFQGEISPLMRQHDHEAHFKGMAGSPHLLMGHFAIHSLGLLAGGKILSAMISRAFGADCVHLYDFSPDPEGLKAEFKSELDQYMLGLTDAQVRELQNEMEHIWEFAGDLTGNDIRK
ncbi:MAG: biliverdin-producing heme oxygenase [Verrucomicrobia bacterium]|nr:biliverdin-producing heme oxygenase [Verrucomicrobiota bacterium]